MRRNRNPGFNTRAIHFGYDASEEKGAVTPPVHFSTTFEFENVEEAALAAVGQGEAFIYGRTRNPTQELLESRLADLEGGEAAMAAGSGMAAISSLFWSLLSQGDELVAHTTLYGNTHALVAEGLPRFGVTVKRVDLADPAAVEAGITDKTRLVFFETPANPDLAIVDVQAVSEVAKAHGALTVVDNTFASPALQRPIERGADAVVHSMTKFLGGHSDVIAGALIGPDEVVTQTRRHGLRYLTGGALAPLSAFMVLRGLKTLGVRVERQSRNAMAVARFLEGHPKIAKVLYPGLESHPRHAVAKAQMSDFGGLLAFELKGGAEEGRRFMNALKLASRAVSLGGCETLVQHPASMTHATYSAEDLARAGLTDGLIRASIGLEDEEDILEDFEAALG